ncbi:MAG: hypothetical protein ABIQ99_16030 [Thermoflexales bacterium]
MNEWSPSVIQSLERGISALLARKPDEECEFILQFEEHHPDYSSAILAWVLGHNSSYVGTRIWAATRLYERDPHQVESLTRTLLFSADPDDRDTAISSLIELPQLPFVEDTRLILKDEYQYLQILAAEYFVLHSRGHEVSELVEALCRSSKDQIRQQALLLRERI